MISDIDQLKKDLLELDQKRSLILKKIQDYQTQNKTDTQAQLGRPSRPTAPITTQDKIALFLELFRCRESIYPKYWENQRTNKKGYSPVCSNEWISGVCEKPRIKCADCKFQAFAPLDSSVAEAHLKGLITIGTYAIKEDDKATFLACDFDGQGWREDVMAYKNAATILGVDCAIERSRSGLGAHAWIFFEAPIHAREARQLGTLILSKAIDTRFQIDLKSFDRFFPNQDTLPEGGFGNLIALPLQKNSRDQGNTVFLDNDFNIISDQWQYLPLIRRLNLNEVRSLINIPAPQKMIHSDGDNDWSLDKDEAIIFKPNAIASEKCLEGMSIEIFLGAMIRINITNLPAKFVTSLKKIATFANPEFYKRQRMRRATYPEPRFIFSGEIQENDILLPRGSLDEVKKTLKNFGADVLICDQRPGRKKLSVAFNGNLRLDQEKAVNEILKNDYGILEAPPGAGKTVMGCALIAKRKVSTLILVHRQPLFDQWRERLQEFLGLTKKEIGALGANKKATGKIDIAMLQTLTRMKNFDEIAENYAQIIIDEAHHIPAASFEGIMKILPARYVVGLTATPYRKDGLQKIIFQQCGPIRHTMSSVDGGQLAKKVIVRETNFNFKNASSSDYHVLIHALISDLWRNQLILEDLITVIDAKRFPVLISDRKDHLDFFEAQLKLKFEDKLSIIKMVGDDGKKLRKEHLVEVQKCLQNQTAFIILATGSLIGEGFDLPELDTLFITTPLSFKGRIVQYAGRLHRQSNGKKDIAIYDYVDSSIAITLGMYRKRAKTYRSMGYFVEEPFGLVQAKNRNSFQIPAHAMTY